MCITYIIFIGNINDLLELLHRLSVNVHLDNNQPHSKMSSTVFLTSTMIDTQKQVIQR